MPRWPKPTPVRFGSFGDIGATLAEVRFVSHSGPITRRQLTSPQCHYRRLRAITTRSHPFQETSPWTVKFVAATNADKIPRHR